MEGGIKRCIKRVARVGCSGRSPAVRCATLHLNLDEVSADLIVVAVVDIRRREFTLTSRRAF